MKTLRLTLSAWGGSLRRMVRHIRVLGVLRGLQYWRIENACRRDPEMVIRWAVRCEHEAARCILRGDEHGEAMMTGWAGELRASHRRYVPNDQAQRRGGENL